MVGYDGARNVRDEERSVWQTKPNRKQSEETKQSRWGFRGMTVRNRLELLIVPMVLVGIGLLFEMQQADRQQATEMHQQRLAEQRAQDEALQAYLSQMSQLMLDRKLLEAEQGDTVYTLAQARTSTVILRLDSEHNESVTRFLSNSGLAESSEASPGLLREIPLSHATLSDAYLRNAFLGEADLSHAFLLGADLSHRAFLAGTDLSGAVLVKAKLSGAVLVKAKLSGAVLNKANLNGAEGITNEELEQQAKSLEGATMPNGQMHEDWIKDKKAREEGG